MPKLSAVVLVVCLMSCTKTKVLCPPNMINLDQKQRPLASSLHTHWSQTDHSFVLKMKPCMAWVSPPTRTAGRPQRDMSKVF